MAILGVSGGGVAGMAAALAARRAGHDVTLFARPDTHPPAGGVQIAPNGWAALESLGLGDAARACSTRLHTITVRALDSGATLIRLPLHDPYASFGRAALAGLVEEALGGTGRITRIAEDVAHIHQDDGHVTLITAAGTSHKCDGLIAADGGKGPGRRRCGAHPVGPVARAPGIDDAALRVLPGLEFRVGQA